MNCEQRGRNPDEMSFHLLHRKSRIFCRRTTPGCAAPSSGAGRTRCRSCIATPRSRSIREAPAHGSRRNRGRRRNRLGHARGRRAVAARTGLALDADGFIQVTDTLQTVTDPNVFAAGDIASMLQLPAREGGRIRGAPGPAVGGEPASRGGGRSRSSPIGRKQAGSR